MTTEKLTPDAYMELLVQRQNDWLKDNPPRSRGRLTSLPPLLEWFVRPGDEHLVELPEPPVKPKPQPRTYRSAASLRAARDVLIKRRDAIMFDGPADRAAANVSTPSRWKKLDRDITAVVRLSNRINALDYRIKDADRREQT